jgi:tetratricopeptide (TPR) repeat protein
MAEIFEQKLRDEEKAMAAYEQITKVFRGSSVAEDAAWKIAGFYERKSRHGEAVDAYGDFIRNYPQSDRVGDAQFALAETLEKLGRWVEAMDAYTTYANRYPDGPLTARSREQINWIKAYRL